MVDRPLILRARIRRELAARHPKGMTAGQVLQYVAHAAIPARELAALLDALVEGGLAVRSTEARPHPREPLATFVAAPKLLTAEAPGGCP